MANIHVTVERDLLDRLPRTVEGVDIRELVEIAGPDNMLTESEACGYVDRVLKGEAGAHLSSEVKFAMQRHGVQGYLASVARAKAYIDTNYNYVPSTGELALGALGARPGPLLVYFSEEGSWASRRRNQFVDGLRRAFE